MAIYDMLLRCQINICAIFAVKIAAECLLEVIILSKKSIEKIKKMWRDLVFAKVTGIVAKDIDIDKITVYKNGSDVSPKIYKKVKDVPVDDWKDAVISYKKFYGFAEGILFHSNDLNELDMEIDMTLDFSTWWNHKGTHEVPKEGMLIAGSAILTPRGKKFTRWFVCSPQLKLLMDMILTGKIDFSEAKLSEKLICGRYPDTYWGIARLVLFDDVQAFVDELKENRPVHPNYGKIYDQWGPYKIQVSWNGMYLSKNVAQFVHELSFHLDEPMWWEKFNQLAKGQGLKHSHPGPGGFCVACARS